MFIPESVAKVFSAEAFSNRVVGEGDGAGAGDALVVVSSSLICF